MATITGTPGQDRLSGGLEPDVILGFGGDDLLVGGLGDALYAGDGNDTLDVSSLASPGDGRVLSLFGGDGDDTYVVDNHRPGAIDDSGGHDTLIVVGRWDASSYGLGLRDGIEDVVLRLEGRGGPNSGYLWVQGNDLDNTIRGDSGTVGFSLIGGDGDDTLLGGAGGDHLSGGRGSDLLRGGEGRDYYDDVTSGDRIVEAADGGYDIVVINGSGVRLSGEIEEIRVEFDIPMRIVGTTSANLILSGDSDDSIFSRGGDDHVRGGDGDDHIFGGAGNDVLDGDFGRDVIRGGAGDDALYGGFVWLGGDYEGDRLIGGAGDDTYYLEATVPREAGADVVVEAAGGGYDTVIVGRGHLMSVNVEALVVLAEARYVSIIGNDADNVITMLGRDSHLEGMGGDDSLRGGQGNDTLDGGRGRDRMHGGEGSDVYVVDSAEDIVKDSGFGGQDRVESSVGWALNSSFENLTLTGSDGVVGIGNAGGNRLVGNSGDNRLQGGGGGDGLRGGGGRDDLLGGEGDDGLWGEAADDRLEGGNGEDLLVGGAGADQLFGGDGNDSLAGASGDDALTGGAGSDDFFLESGSDRVLDFRLGVDSLVFDDALGNGAALYEEDLLGFARVTSAGVVFDFGDGDVFLIAGVRDLDDLSGSLYYF